MQSLSQIPCLILFYKRFEYAEKIVSRCIEKGVNQFYFAIDGPRDIEDRKLQLAGIALLKNICDVYGVSYKLSSLSSNRGIFINMITALEWFFEANNFGIILEDDTVPELDFFDFFCANMKLLESDSRVLMLSGWRGETIKTLGSNEVELCSFPLIWGWGTTSSKWKLMSGWFFEGLRIDKNQLKTNIFFDNFWRTGYRRAVSGKLDSWSIILTYNFLINGFKSVVPEKSLIENVGFDKHATNSRRKYGHLSVRIGAKNHTKLDKWLIREIYSISFHHFLSPLYAPIIDFISRRTRRVPPLEFLNMKLKNGLLRENLRLFL